MDVRTGAKLLKKRKTLGIVAGALLIILGGGIAYGLSAGEPPGLVLFIGRFHPLVVHLPIGILAVALLMEGLLIIETWSGCAREAPGPCERRRPHGPDLPTGHAVTGFCSFS